MNTMSFPTQDEDRESIDYSYSKPIDIETLYWVKSRMRLLEVQKRMSDRTAIFEEFYIKTTITRTQS